LKPGISNVHQNFHREESLGAECPDAKVRNESTKGEGGLTWRNRPVKTD